MTRYGTADANPGQNEDQAARFNADPRVPTAPPIGGWHQQTADSVLDLQFTHHGMPLLGWGGYNETEVDEALDQVWHTLSRHEQNNELLLGIAGQLERRGDATSRDFAVRIRQVLEWPKS